MNGCDQFRTGIGAGSGGPLCGGGDCMPGAPSNVNGVNVSPYQGLLDAALALGAVAGQMKQDGDKFVTRFVQELLDVRNEASEGIHGNIKI